ncbi:MAG: DUF6044 family protein [Oscillospiraceae bacterium]|nr:DUF6044 family protein [Oscillospiraceae bacterium]
MRLKHRKKHLENAFITLLLLIAVAPLLWHGKDSLLTIPDGLNQTFAWNKMLKDNGILFAVDSPTNQLGNMSAVYYSNINFNILTFVNFIFDTFTAFIVNYALKILIGYISMYLLLRHLFPDKKNVLLIKLVSVSFAILPSIPIWWVALDSVPLLCLAFLLIMKCEHKKVNFHVFLLLLYPFLSFFATVGIFLCMLWALGILIVWIRDKSLNINLVIGLCCLAVGYAIVDMKLFYSVLALNEPLSRTLPYAPGPGGGDVTDRIADLLMTWIFFGPGESWIQAVYVITPITFAALIWAVLHILRKNKNDEHIKEREKLSSYCISAIALLGAIVAIVLIGYGLELFTRIIYPILPFMEGFYFERIGSLNRASQYIFFALTLTTLLEITRKKKAKFLLYAAAILQIAVVLTTQGGFAYTGNNLFYDKNVQKDSELTFNEFYDEDFFSYIMDDIDYNGEGVAALGFHPSVLMYNGFSCADCYLNTNPVSQYYAFEQVIAPQLERNLAHKDHYENWGRIFMYLYADGIHWQPTRNKASNPVELHINTQAFRDLGGVYIFSRAEISNAADIELRLSGYYADDESIYDIWLYKVQ